MADIQGYCMKCKTYGPIINGKKIAMANGRARMAGSCSTRMHRENFERSLRELITNLHRIDLIEMSGGSTYLGLVV